MAVSAHLGRKGAMAGSFGNEEVSITLSQSTKLL